MMPAQADLSSDVEQGNAGLPKGWEWKRLGDVSRTTSGGTPSRKVAEYFEGDIPWVKSGELPDGNVTEIAEYITEDAVKNSSAKLFPAGTLLIALYGATVGKLGVLTQDATTNQAVCAVFPHDGLDPMYLFWYLRYARSALIGQAVGGAQPNISQGILRDLQIPIAPYEQQGRIVAEIEKQFSRLDEAVANLKRVKANLKRYKAAVLKAAVEGKLTEEWRAAQGRASVAGGQEPGATKAHPDVEPASKLLDRILAERRAKWEEAELAKMEAKGKAPKNDKWKARYKEPLAPAHEDASDLPKGWAWSRTDQLFWFVTSGSRGWAKYYTNSGPIFLRVGNLDHDSIELDLQDLQHVQPPEGAEGTRTKVMPGDVLISITADVGMIAVVQEGLGNAYINQHISLARPVNVPGCEYVAWYLAARPGQKQFQDLQRGATKAGLGLDDIKGVDVPLPPLEEQHQIVQEIEGRLSLVNDLDLQVDANIQRATRIRQSILHDAFLGRVRGHKA